MKFILIALVIAGLIITYVLLAAEQPAINDIISTANASANWTRFESAQSAVNAFPIYMWAIPGLVAIVLVVMILRGQGQQKK